MMHALICFGPQTRNFIASRIEADIRALDMLDGLQDLEPEPHEDDGDAERQGDSWPNLDGDAA